MNRTIRNLIWIFAVLFTFAGVSDETENNSRKVKIPLIEQKKIYHVEVDSSNLRREELLPDKKTEKKTGKHFSDDLGECTESIFWNPASDFSSGTVGLRVRDIAQSPDRSVLVFLEETGKQPEGPFGGRLIVYDVPGKRILRVIESTRRIGKIAVVPGNGSVLGYANAEKRMENQPAGFVEIDLKSGRELRFLPMKNIGLFTVSGDLIVLAATDAADLDILNFSGESIGKIKLNFIPERLVASPLGKIVAASSGRTVAFANLSSPDKKKIVNLPENNWNIARLVPSPDDPFTLLAVTDGGGIGKGSLFLIRDGSFVRRIASDATGHVAFFPGMNAAAYTRLQKKQIVRINLKNGAVTAYGNPQSMRPATYGSTYAVFPSPGKDEILLMDSTGSVSVFQSAKRRWIKNPLPGVQVRDGGH